MKLGKFELDKVYCGDSKELMKDLPNNSIDLIVTDPPYQLSSISRARPDQTKEGSYGKEVPFSRQQSRIKKGFMGKKWDILPPIEVWKESLRILKPGAFAFIMTTPRQDSLSQILMDLTNAGFFMGFSSIYWTYASGFPKATNISLAIDKQECKKQLTKKLGRKPTKEEFKKEWREFREIIGKKKLNPRDKKAYTPNKFEGMLGTKTFETNPDMYNITKPTSEKAKVLNGSYGGFQSKPAVEIIIVAMKPLSEKTYVDQALKNRKGITWLDDGRIPYESKKDRESVKTIQGKSNNTGIYGGGKGLHSGLGKTEGNPQGRFPANLLVSDDVLNDGRVRKSGDLKEGHKRGIGINFGGGGIIRKDYGGDSGSFSRYFDLDKWAVAKGVKDTFPFLIVPKASKSEKDKGLEGFKDIDADKIDEQRGKATAHNICPHHHITNCPCGWKAGTRKNIHPTVKPKKLAHYLITLGSREGDIMLDNFCGSGTFLVSAKELNRRFLGFDTEMEYVIISKARLSAITAIQEKLF